jgi:hypothetical protein
MILHYLAILSTASLSLKLGICSKLKVDSQISEVLQRPPEDTATMFAFLKQQFYHKSLAYTNFEKSKVEQLRRERDNILKKCLVP